MTASSDVRELLDLVVLVADKDMEQAVNALLQRPQSFGIHAISYRIFTHPTHDSGCRTGAHDLLRSLAAQYRFALVMFDLEGSGRDAVAPEKVASEVEAKLASNGWANRCCVLVLDPELEIWAWTDSVELDQVIGWAGRQPEVRDWLRAQNFEVNEQGKPKRPKEALRAALREVRKQPSAALFAALAARVGLSRCTNPAFAQFRDILRRWFSA